MKNRTAMVLAAVTALVLIACNSDEADITTTTLDASLLTTTTTSTTTPESDTTGDGTSDTTEEPSDPVASFEVISRTSSEEGETLYILVPPGEYSDVSMENFLGDLLEDETAVAGVEVFDDRAALDAALKAEDERTDDEAQLIEEHHLVTLVNGRQVEFQGPMSDFDDFVIGS